MMLDTLCSDFEVLDVWRIPVRGGRDDFDGFYRVFVDNGLGTDSVIASALFKMRFALGRLFHLDGGAPAPIPGCRETSVAERLSDDDRRRNRADRVLPAGLPAEFRPVYLDDAEALIEVSNRTIHALIHLAWIPAGDGAWTPELTVLIKSRGRLSALYMALIAPFRHHVVYPAWFRSLRRAWEQRLAA